MAIIAAIGGIVGFLGLAFYLVRVYKRHHLHGTTNALIIENLDQAVILLDSQVCLLRANAAARRLLCLSQDSIGQPLVDLFPAHRPSIKPLLNSKKPSHFVLDVATKDGDRILDVRFKPVVAGTIAFTLVVEDVTEDRQHDEEREQLISALDDYAHTVAHDLKNPLSAIGGFATLIKEPTIILTEGEILNYVDQIQDMSMKMHTIIDDLLLLASVRDRSDIKIEPVVMRTVIHDAMDRLECQVVESDARIHLSESWPHAIGHPLWIEEIWCNFISNAIKYGGEPPDIRLGHDSPKPGYVRYWVEDNGPGVPERHQHTIFEKFNRLKEHARKDGNGLGLSIVRQIAERLSGEAGYEDAPNGGSRFYFTLPAFEPLDFVDDIDGDTKPIFVRQSDRQYVPMNVVERLPHGKERAVEDHPDLTVLPEEPTEPAPLRYG